MNVLGAPTRRTQGPFSAPLPPCPVCRLTTGPGPGPSLLPPPWPSAGRVDPRAPHNKQHDLREPQTQLRAPRPFEAGTAEGPGGEKAEGHWDVVDLYRVSSAFWSRSPGSRCSADTCPRSGAWPRPRQPAASCCWLGPESAAAAQHRPRAPQVPGGPQGPASLHLDGWGSPGSAWSHLWVLFPRLGPGDALSCRL